MGPRHPITRGARRGARPQRARTLGATVAGLVVVAGSLAIYSRDRHRRRARGRHGAQLHGHLDGRRRDLRLEQRAIGTPASPKAAASTCRPRGATVVVQNATFSIGELTVAKGSSLTVGGDAGGTGQAGASLSVSSGLDNGGTLTAGPTGTGTGPGTGTATGTGAGAGTATLTLGGPNTNTGTFSVSGTVTIGVASPSSLTNAGTDPMRPCR